MALTFRQRTQTATQIAMGVWLLLDGTTVVVPVSQAEHETWLSGPQNPEQYPSKPINGVTSLVRAGGILALNTPDGLPRVGDYWNENGKVAVHVESGWDWSYAFETYRPLTADTVEKCSRKFTSSGHVLRIANTGELVALNPVPAVYQDTGEIRTVEPRHHSVAYDSTASAGSVGSSTSISYNIAIGSGSNRAIAVGLSTGAAAAITNPAVTVDSVNAPLISGAQILFSIDNNSRAYGFGLASPNSGASKAVSVTWTTSNYCYSGAVAAEGVDQTTPFTANTDEDISQSSHSISITSTNGDLTMSVGTFYNGAAPSSTNQTSRWAAAESSQVGSGGDTGPGTGTTTHTWTTGAGDHSVKVGINFNQSTGGPAGPVVPTHGWTFLRITP